MVVMKSASLASSWRYACVRLLDKARSALLRETRGVVRGRSQKIGRPDSLPSTAWVNGEEIMDEEEVDKIPGKTDDL